MKNITTLLILLAMSGFCSAGCMSGKINAVNKELKTTSVSDDVKAEIIKIHMAIPLGVLVHHPDEDHLARVRAQVHDCRPHGLAVATGGAADHLIEHQETHVAVPWFVSTANEKRNMTVLYHEKG